MFYTMFKSIYAMKSVPIVHDTTKVKNIEICPKGTIIVL